MQQQTGRRFFFFDFLVVVVASSFHFSTSLAIRFRLEEEIYGMPFVLSLLKEPTKEKIGINRRYYSGVVTKEKRDDPSAVSWTKLNDFDFSF